MSTVAFLTGTGVHFTYSEGICVAYLLAVENVWTLCCAVINGHRKTFLLAIVCNAGNDQQKLQSNSIMSHKGQNTEGCPLDLWSQTAVQVISRTWHLFLPSPEALTGSLRRAHYHLLLDKTFFGQLLSLYSIYICSFSYQTICLIDFEYSSLRKC